MTVTMREMLLPDDAFDQQLIAHVHPPDWVNPTPQGKYNLVVLGAGTAGLVSAGGTGGLGGKVALIEKALMGGDCLNLGCVPSKAVIRAARAIYDARQVDAVQFNQTAQIQFAKAMARMRRLRAEIAPHDSAQRFTNEFNVDVFIGDGKFISRDEIEVAGQRLRFDRAVIATGARAAVPPIAGLQEAGYYTNETIFTLTSLPARLAVIGAGPIGCELAQAWQRFGSQVVVIDLDEVLPREDRDVAAIVQQQMEREGVEFLLNANIVRAEQRNETRALIVAQQGTERVVLCDAILVATGRTPNVDGLGLEVAEVKFSKHGVAVDDRLRTSNPRIYAAGDVCSQFKFTHAADAMARNVIANAFFFGRRKVSALTIPWCTFTDPEVAHVGYSEPEAQRAEFAVATITQPFEDVDRAVLDGETAGLARVHYDTSTGKILGGTIVARHAGEMIGQLTQAITMGLKMSALANTIQPYPVQADALKKIGDVYMRTKLTPTVRTIFQKWFAWRRR
ncbi:MAG TPA: mercuric reductase [Blastocatellia bacterium]|nr:mercuric reductase [Blastocatellia bacterium]